jgi:hypothetical protein
MSEKQMPRRADNGRPRAGLNGESRRHVRLIVRQTLLLSAMCLPMALVADHPLVGYLQLLRLAFGFSSAIATVAAVLTRTRLTPDSLCMWDHIAALILFKYGCALALDGLA